MGRFPIFQTPELDAAETRMREGQGFGHGYLGGDSRKLVEILNEDEATVGGLGLTHGEIAARLEQIADEARCGMGQSLNTRDGRFQVKIETARGKLPCPFGHGRLFPKTHVTLKNLKTGEELAWSDLSAHMIGEHGFYQGKGSPYRLEPADIKRILEL